MSNRKIAKMEDNGQNIHAPDKVSANTCLTVGEVTPGTPELEVYWYNIRKK